MSDCEYVFSKEGEKIIMKSLGESWDKGWRNGFRWGTIFAFGYIILYFWIFT